MAELHRIDVRVGEADFDPGAELTLLEGLGGGAVASFTGVVRDDPGSGGGLEALHLEHYPAMTGQQLDAIVQEAVARWPLLGVTLVHRVGTLDIGARIVFVGVASRHRVAALEACAFLIDWLKVSAPFWKQERRRDGSCGWVEAKDSDDALAARWKESRSK